MIVRRFNKSGASWIVLIFLIFSFLPSMGQTVNCFVLPVDSPVRLAGTFGELRSAHFHTGLDFRTGGVEGKSVCASGDGWVSRVKISTVGFGVVVYIDHANGFTTVYAHLHHVLGPLADYVDSAQQAMESYEVELFPDSGRFMVLSGEVIALSGNSGGSEGPHLHFEVRERSKQIPINPLRFFSLADSSSPAISELIFYEQNEGRFDQAGTLELDKTKHPPEVVIPCRLLPAGVAFAARMDDFDAPNLLGIYTASFAVEGENVFSFEFDSLSFDEGRYANAHSVMPRFKSRFHRLHRLPGNKSASFKTKGSGVITMNDTLPVSCELIARDFAGNADTLNFIIRVTDEKDKMDKGATGSPREFNVRYKYDTVNVVKPEYSRAALEIPAGAAYQDFFLSLYKDRSVPSGLTECLRIKMKEDVPFHKPAKLSIPFLSGSLIGLSATTGLVVTRWDDQGKRKEVLKPDSILKDMVVVKIRQQGRYLAEIDTLSPTIESWTQELDSVDGHRYEVLRLNDNISGIAAARVLQTDKWMKSILDPRTNTLRWVVADPLLRPSYYSVMVKDVAGNQRIFNLIF
jgi:hypothetical protein